MKNYYITIEGFMIQKLKLSGCELLVYAIYYSFYISTDEPCFISAKRLAEMVGVSDRAVRTARSHLVSLNYLLETYNEDKDQKLLFANPRYAERWAEETSGGDEETSGGAEETSVFKKKVTKENININLNTKKEEELERIIEIAKTSWIDD